MSLLQLMSNPGHETAGRRTDEVLACRRPIPVSHHCVKQARILIVDDEPINIKAVEKHLRKLGYENLQHTTDSRQVINLVVMTQPDIVLLDVMMPYLDGLEVLQQIRAHERCQHVPVLVLTAYCDTAHRHAALDAGATDFLGKPVDPRELARRVFNSLIVKLNQDQLIERAAQLETEVRRQAEALAAAKQSAEVRYLAGKAEIATDVLHNVGNALNSVNVGVDLVAASIRDSHLPSLRRAVDLLVTHRQNLARFLTNDERGRLLPLYLIEVADFLLAERERMSSEINAVKKHLEHIDSVVTLHQNSSLCTA